MRVATGYEIDSIHLRCNLTVANPALPGVGVVTKVRHPHNQRAVFYLAQGFHHIPRRLHRIVILHTFEICRRDQIVRAHTHPDEADTHATNHTYRVRLYNTLEPRTDYILVTEH